MISIDLKRVSHASVFLMLFYIVKSILSVLVKSSIAISFGAGIESDAYFAAFTFPQQVELKIPHLVEKFLLLMLVKESHFPFHGQPV